MAKIINFSPISIRVTSEVKELFEETFQASGSNSKGDFLKSLLDLYFDSQEEKQPAQAKAQEPAQPQTIEKIIEKERELAENEILLSLNPAQLFALKETILGNPKFITAWNEEIEKMKNGNSPFLYFGNLCNTEFGCIWNEFQELKSDDDLETLKQNIAAELLNSYMVRIIEGEIEYSIVTPRILKEFIKGEKEKQLTETKKNDK